MSNDKISLKLEAREAKGKKVAKLRKDGLLPGVVYGHGFEAIAVQAPKLAVEKAVKQAGGHAPVHLTIDGKRKIAMIKNIDVNPAKNSVRHVEFHAVKQNEKVEAEIPIKLVGVGESEAEKAGLIVLQTLETLKVKALPMELPEALEVSIIDLSEPNQHLTVADIKVPEGVEISEDNEEIDGVTIASVWEPSALQAANEATGGDAEDETDVEAEHGEGEAAEGEEASAENSKEKQEETKGEEKES